MSTRKCHVAIFLTLLAAVYAGTTGNGTCATEYCPCNAGYTGGNFISPYSATACARFIALMPNRSLQSVSTRTGVARGSAIMPTYNATGGPNGKGHVSFDRTQPQYLRTGTRTLNINTNGGFSMVMIFRFTGTVKNNEYLLDMDALYGINMYRDRSYADLTFEVSGGSIYSDSSSYFNSGKVVQNSWHTVKLWYIASTLQFLFQINDLSIMGGWTESPIPDMSTWIYLSTSSTNYAFNGDIAGFFFVDEYMTAATLTAIAAEMTGGLDLTDTTCPAGNACAACPAGKYKAVAGTAPCTNCSAGWSSDAVGGTSSAACYIAGACAAGSSGPDGGPCAACVAGKYKDAPGTAPCTTCGAGSLSPAGSARADACVCGAGFKPRV